MVWFSVPHFPRWVHSKIHECVKGCPNMGIHECVKGCLNMGIHEGVPAQYGNSVSLSSFITSLMITCSWAFQNKVFRFCKFSIDGYIKHFVPAFYLIHKTKITNFNIKTVGLHDFGFQMIEQLKCIDNYDTVCWVTLYDLNN